jgi:hypothetical protein
MEDAIRSAHRDVRAAGLHVVKCKKTADQVVTLDSQFAFSPLSNERPGPFLSLFMVFAQQLARRVVGPGDPVVGQFADSGRK